MKKLMKLQLRNLFYSKVFYICTILTIVLSVGLTYITSLFSTKIMAPKVLPQIVGIFTGGVDIIGMIFITVYCVLDFNEGTTKNIIARGYSKTKLLISKYISAFIGMILLDLIVSLVIFILYIKNGFGYENTLLLQLLYGICCTLTYTIFYVTISFILEKTSSSIIANLFILKIINLILVFTGKYLKIDISKFWLENVGATFMDKPTLSHLAFPLLMYAAYIAVFSFIGIYIAKNKEIK